MTLLDSYQRNKQRIQGGSQITGSQSGGSVYDSYQRNKSRIISQPKRQPKQVSASQPQQQQPQKKKSVFSKVKSFFTKPDLISPVSDFEPPKQTLQQKIGAFKFNVKQAFKTIKDRGTREEQIKRSWQDVGVSVAGSVSSLADSLTKFYETGSDKIEKKKGETLKSKTFKKSSDVTRKVSKAINKWSEEIVPENPDFIDSLVQGGGSILTFAFISSLTGGSSIAPAITEALMESGPVYETNRAKGMSIDEASKRADRNFGVNLVINYLTDKFGIFGDRSAGLKKMLISGPLEGIQEALQQISSNIETDNDPMAGVLESFQVGGILGAIVSLIMPGKGMKVFKKDTKGELNTGPVTPDEAMNYVTSNDLGKTTEGKEIVKAVLEAKRQDKNIDITFKENGKVIKTEVTGVTEEADTPPPVQEKKPLEVKKQEPIAGESREVVQKYTSAKDYAEAEFGAKPENQMGEVDAETIIARDEVDVKSDRYIKLKADIEKNGFQESIRVTIEKEGPVTTEGSNRVTIAKELKLPIPVIVNKGQIEGLKTIQEVYDELSVKEDVRSANEIKTQVLKDQSNLKTEKDPEKIKTLKEDIKKNEVLLKQAEAKETEKQKPLKPILEKKKAEIEKKIEKLSDKGKKLETIKFDNLPEIVQIDIADQINADIYGDLSKIDSKTLKDFFFKNDVDIIEIDPKVLKSAFGTGRRTNKIAVEKFTNLILKGSKPPPVLIANERFVDGGHRVESAIKAGEKTIKAVDITSVLKDAEKFAKEEDIKTFIKAKDVGDIPKPKKEVVKKKPVKKAEKPIPKGFKESRAVQRVKDTLAETVDLDETLYKTLSLDDVARRSVELVNKNPKLAQDIISGHAVVPEGLTKAGVLIASAEQARKAKNYKSQKDLILQRSFMQTRHGQEIVTERLVNDLSSDRFIRDVLKVRMDKAIKSVKKGTSKAKAFSDRVATGAKGATKKVTKQVLNKVQSAQQLINDLTCP